jgi:hypothetical protein
MGIQLFEKVNMDMEKKSNVFTFLNTYKLKLKLKKAKTQNTNYIYMCVRT